MIKMENPKFKKSTVTSLTIKGAYSRGGMIQTDDAEYDLLALLNCFVHRTVSCTCSEILTFFVHSECIPCRWSEDFVFGNIVHTNGNAQN